jgi:hypothetical protein
VELACVAAGSAVPSGGLAPYSSWVDPKLQERFIVSESSQSSGCTLTGRGALGWNPTLVSLDPVLVGLELLTHHAPLRSPPICPSYNAASNV